MPAESLRARGVVGVIGGILVPRNDLKQEFSSELFGLSESPRLLCLARRLHVSPKRFSVSMAFGPRVL